MNSRPDKETELLAEAFHGEWTAGEPAGFARAAAAHARNRRRTRQVLMAAASSAALIAIALMAWVRQPGPDTHFIAPPPTVATAVARGYEIISDEELLAYLNRQPLLIVKRENGTREIILLDNKSAAESFE